MNPIVTWFRRNFSNPQLVILLLLLLGGAILLFTLGRLVAPVLAALVLAYLLDGLVTGLQRAKIPRAPAVMTVFLLFITFLVLIVLLLVPFVIEETGRLIQQTPQMVAQLKSSIAALPEKRPDFIKQEQFNELVRTLQSNTELISAFQRKLTELGQVFLSQSFAIGKELLTFLVYIILVPLMVFFFLKDKHKLLGWFVATLPDERGLADKVWKEVDQQLSNYVRGKFLEILIVWLVTYVVFHYLNLQYAMLLSLFVGLSVLLPYIGATFMTVPVVLIAWFQPDYTTQQMIWVTVAYLIIQALDGNVLAPLLLSEVTNLHPIAIIASILVFGGLWGFWGVFFAIPLATLVNAVSRAWRSQQTNAASHPPCPPVSGPAPKAHD